MTRAEERGEQLLAIARAALADIFSSPGRTPGRQRAAAAWLAEPAATFVTLRLDGRLRGCIGSLAATRPLRDDLRSNAVAAATEDPRFPPLRAEELAGCRVEVSLLSSARPIAFSSRDDLLARLRPGRDGLVLRWREHRATLLPQVWDSLPHPDDFVEALLEKAGLPRGFWRTDLVVERYEVEHWSEP